MKHTILILVHKNLKQLIPLVEYFYKDCTVFVHIDKKCTIEEDIMRRLNRYPWVYIMVKQYDIHWGGFSMLKAELSLFSMILRTRRTDYIHLISGQDFPIKPLATFLKFFEQNKEKNFIEYQIYPFDTPEPEIYSRGKYILPYDFVDGRSSQGFNIVCQWVSKQKRRREKRTSGCLFSHRYKGSQWFSVTYHAMQQLLDYTQQHPSFCLSLRYTFAPEEIYMPTVWANILPTESIVVNNLRYIRWSQENGSCPANLGIEHYTDIANSLAFFARKMQLPYCEPLINAINQNLLTK